LASFQVGLSKNFSWPFFGFISSWLALKIRLAFWLFFDPFPLKQVPMKENTSIPFFSATCLQNFCDK